MLIGTRLMLAKLLHILLADITCEYNMLIVEYKCICDMCDVYNVSDVTFNVICDVICDV